MEAVAQAQCPCWRPVLPRRRQARSRATKTPRVPALARSGEACNRRASPAAASRPGSTARGVGQAREGQLPATRGRTARSPWRGSTWSTTMIGTSVSGPQTHSVAAKSRPSSALSVTTPGSSSNLARDDLVRSTRTSQANVTTARPPSAAPGPQGQRAGTGPRGLASERATEWAWSAGWSVDPSVGHSQQRAWAQMRAGRLGGRPAGRASSGPRRAHIMPGWLTACIGWPTSRLAARARRGARLGGAP